MKDITITLTAQGEDDVIFTAEDLAEIHPEALLGRIRKWLWTVAWQDHLKDMKEKKL